MTRRRGTGRAMAGAAVVVLLLAGCALVPQQSPKPTPPSASATTAPRPSASSSSASPTADSAKGRPLLTVPDVKPAGFAAPPPGRGLGRYTGQTLDWAACGTKGLECVTTLAPLDYTRPDGQALTLALTRKKAGREPRLGSLFINPGGPGGSGTDYVAQFRSTGLEQYDIVGWDPRGVGKSTPVTCFNGSDFSGYLDLDNSPDSDAETEALLRAETSFGRSCLQRSGPLLQHVSTTETVRDLDLLRGLVGDPRLNYFGSSYGTQVGALYAQLFPARVGRVVLDGAVNITGDDSVSQAQGFDRALGTFASWCVRQDCGLGRSKDEVVDAVTGLWQRLDAKPMAAGSRKLTQSLAVTAVSFVLYQPERAFPYLAQALQLALEDDDGRYLLFFADQYNERGKDGAYGQGNFAFPAVRCLDSRETSVAAAEKDWERVQKAAPSFGRFAGLDLVCARWPVAPAPKLPKIVGAGAAPILVIGTTGDPATPYEYAESMAKQLDSGVLITWDGEGHLAYGKSGCVQGLVVDYLVADRVPADGTRC